MVRFCQRAVALVLALSFLESVCSSVRADQAAVDALRQYFTYENLVSDGSITEENLALIKEAYPSPKDFLDALGLERQLMPLEVIAVYRGEQGVELQQPKPVEPFSAPAEIRETANRAFLDDIDQVSERTHTIKDIPDCSESKTERHLRAYSDNLSPEKQKEVFYDRLYMRRENIPVRTGLLYGRETIVREFYTSEYNDDSAIAAINGVKCVPYRVRATGRFVFTHFGLDALKNFDDDPNGEGKEIKQ